MHTDEQKEQFVKHITCETLFWLQDVKVTLSPEQRQFMTQNIRRAVYAAFKGLENGHADQH
jgi:hypothetical protein